MSDTNPYQAPRADIGQGVALGDFTAALADFTHSRAPLLGVAITFCVMAVVGTASTLYSLWHIDSSARNIGMVYVATSLVTNLLSTAAVFWLRQVVATAEKTTTVEALTTLLRRIGSFWLLAAVLWCAPMVVNLALSFGLYVFPILGTLAVMPTRDAPLIAAAQRFRTMVRICLGVGGVMVLFAVGSQVISPLSLSGVIAIQARVSVFGGVMVQLALGAMAWRQVPALEAFVAQPSASTLAPVAAAHRAFWKVALGIAVALFLYHLLSTIGFGLFF